MKKLLYVMLLAGSIFSLAGCGDDEDDLKEGEDIEEIEEEDEIGDGEIDDE